jgi:hypothetical protein
VFLIVLVVGALGAVVVVWVVARAVRRALGDRENPE